MRRSSTSTRPKPREVSLGATTVRYTVRRSTRARRMSLRVLPGHGLEVVLPRGYTLADAETMIQRERDWVLRALQRVVVDPAPLRSGASVPYLDERLTLRMVPGERALVRRNGAEITVTTLDPDRAREALETWYRAEARRVYAERAQAHATTLGVEFHRIAIKDTRTRWGSCSERGNLNFSWRLMLAPWSVMDYVVAHEVAHLRELNHSPRFWSLLATLRPDYRTPRHWLRQHGPTLAAWPGTAIPS